MTIAMCEPMATVTIKLAEPAELNELVRGQDVLLLAHVGPMVRPGVGTPLRPDERDGARRADSGHGWSGPLSSVSQCGPEFALRPADATPRGLIPGSRVPISALAALRVSNSGNSHLQNPLQTSRQRMVWAEWRMQRYTDGAICTGDKSTP